jgi:chlorite dismutase
MLVTFVGGPVGSWRVRSMTCVIGAPLETIAHVTVNEGTDPAPPGNWHLRGVISHTRYTNRKEAAALAAVQPPLGRPAATFGALIPIRKGSRWWSLAQDERREIYEETSRHTSIGLQYLPRIARRLHHSRDLGEPFDFLTWFEFAPEHEPAFDELLAKLRGSEEWKYVEREVDIRVERTRNE